MMFDTTTISGRITLNLLRFCDASLSMSAAYEKLELSEDMLQAEYKSALILDVGWYGSHEGQFVVLGIRDLDWDDPILRVLARDFVELRSAIRVADDYLASLPS